MFFDEFMEVGYPSDGLTDPAELDNLLSDSEVDAALDEASQLAFDSQAEYGEPDTSAEAIGGITGINPGASGGTGLLSQALGFIKQNPKAAEWMAAGLAGIATSSAANKRADKNAGRTEEERLRSRQRISDSIVGMKPMQSGKQTPMKRIDGSRVYDQNGKPL